MSFRVTLLASMAAVAAGTSAKIVHADPTVTYVGAPHDSVNNEPRDDADRSLEAGRFEEALSLYLIAIERNPVDRKALRDGGRAAHALQKFQLAAELLTRASELSIADAELHYLLGEALWAIGQGVPAKQAHLRSLREIGPAPKQRVEKLWVARIHGRLGDRAAADLIYEALMTATPLDIEAALAQAEMHAGVADWTAAERPIARILAEQPDHARAAEMLAWIHESRGELSDELRLRKTITDSGDERAETLRDYGRALERSGDWAGALVAYRRAAALPDGEKDLELTRALQRVDQRMSVEVAAGAMGRTDPSATGLGGFAGIAVPFGRASHWTLGALHETATSGSRNVYAGELRAAAVLRRNDFVAIAGGKVGVIQTEADSIAMTPLRNVFAPAAFGSVSSGLLAKHLTLTVDGELGSIWRESPRAVFEGGRTHGVTTHAYLTTLRQRLIFDTGAQVRQLRLDSADSETPKASQVLAWTGADLLVWTNFAHEARGQILDDDLLRPTFSADSAVLSYRHYELFGKTDSMFASRLPLANRASIDELSVTLRKVVARGAVAVEARGGFGRDWARELYLGRGALALWISPGPRSRVSLSFELARESVRAFVGERRTGWMNYHVDL